MAEKIHLMADSPCDIPREDVEKYGIEIIGVDITYDGQTKQEFYEIDPPDYWKDLERLEEIPVTAQVTPARYLDLFLKAKTAGCTHLMCMTISSTASGTFNSGVVAKGLFYEEHGDAMRIEMVDSRGYSMVYGQVLLEAARMRDEGRSFDDILAAAREGCARAEALFLVYSLKHLKKSGRITGAAAFVGEALGLRPVLRCIDGVITIVQKARGDKNVGGAMVAELQKCIKNPETQDIIVVHADVPETEIQHIEALLHENFHPKSVRRAYLGPCVTTNTGPNALGIVYFGEKRALES
ncbi:DegV family protein [Oscillospiraceae bacterium OttesenSCG-928-F05]|nr:DegV family protein [Oscillospiraceae bacterium OttesenSCG-928-F05]